MRSGDIVRIKTEEEIKRIPGAEKERTGYRIPFQQDGIYINRDMLASGGYHARILLVENGRVRLEPLKPLEDMWLNTQRWIFIEPMLECAYAVGQRVRVKPFEKIVREYRADIEGIHFPDGEDFSAEKVPTCGKYATIKYNFNGRLYMLTDWSEDVGEAGDATFSKFALEPAEPISLRIDLGERSLDDTLNNSKKALILLNKIGVRVFAYARHPQPQTVTDYLASCRVGPSIFGVQRKTDYVISQDSKVDWEEVYAFMLEQSEKRFGKDFLKKFEFSNEN